MTTPTTTQPNTYVPGSPLPLVNIDADYQAPKERMPDPVSARSMIVTLMQANRVRALINAKIKGQIDGNPPYDPCKLKAAAQQYRNNVGYREAKGKLAGAMVPYYDLFTGASSYVSIETDYGTEDDQVAHSRIITEEVDKTLKAWRPFDWNIQLMLNDLVTYAKAFLTMPDKSDWRFGVTTQSKVLFPDGTESFDEKWEVVVIRQVFRVDELWSFIRNRKAAETAGWDVDAVCNAIYNARPQQPTSAETQYDYNFVQQMFKDHDVMWGMRCKTVQAANIYVKEFSGKVTHLIVTEGMMSTGPSGRESQKDQTGFLYKSIEKYEKFSESISTFVFETGDGSINGTQGLGHELYAPMATKDRLLCSAMDLAFIKCSITLQAKTAAAMQKLNLVQIGSITMIPPDFDIQQATIMGDMNAPIEANRVLDQVLDNNTGVYRNEGTKEQGNPRTFGEVRLQYQNNAVLSNSAVNRFYGCLDKHYQTIIPRLLNTSLAKSSTNEGHKLALECQKRIRDRGVPDECLDSKCLTIRAQRVSGNGSLYMRQQAISGMMPLVPMLPESGRQNWLEDAIAVTTSQHMVSRYAPRPDVANLPTDQTDWALLENSAIKQGAPVTWTPTQNNAIHAHIHLNAASQAAATLSQGANPFEVLQFLQGIGQHVAVHIQKLSMDPTRKAEYQMLQQQFQQLAQVTDKLAKQAQQLQQQQAQQRQAQQQAQMVQQGQDPESQVLLARAKQDMAIKQAKTQQLLQDKSLKMQASVAKTKQDMALKDATTAADIQRQHAALMAGP